MCRGCKADHARDWAIRCYHEAQLYGTNCCFVTLTYRDINLPPHGTLDKRDLQLFWKKLRAKTGASLRYFACGEYGEKRSRPHYHAVIFGWKPDDGFPVGKSKAGFIQYGSVLLHNVWGHGRVTFTQFDPACARYTAHYTADKLKSFAAEQIDPETGLRPYERMDISGEIHQLVPEFQTQSKKPPIGIRWLEKYWEDVFPHDSVVMDGREYPPPEAYWKWLKEHQPAVAEVVQAKRLESIKDKKYETGLRRMQKAMAQNAKLDKFVRPYHEEPSK